MYGRRSNGLCCSGVLAEAKTKILSVVRIFIAYQEVEACFCLRGQMKNWMNREILLVLSTVQYLLYLARA